MRTAVGAATVLLLAVGLLAGCGSSAPPLSIAGLDARINPSVPPRPGEIAPVPAAAPDPPGLSSMIGLPTGSTGEITFYFSLPVDDYTLVQAVKVMTTPGTGSYRHFLTSYTAAARAYGAKPPDIEAAVKSVKAKGLSVLIDPSRTFARVWATAAQWRKALGQPLKVQTGTADAPFDVFSFASVPKFDELTYIDAGATVYDPAAGSGGRGYGASVANAAAIDQARASAASPSSAPKVPWPINQGTPPGNTCLSGTSAARSMYTPSQVATAYDTRALVDRPITRAARVAVIDLGGGFLDSDVQGAARCFGYVAPTIDVQTGDGLSGPISANNGETELDLQTIGAYIPGGTIQLTEATNGPASLLDAISHMLANPRGFPDYASISYGQCAVAETKQNLRLIQAIGRLVILGDTVGSSIFAAAGDWGSTTCGSAVPGPSQAFAASAPWATAVGGTRLILNPSNHRADEVVWNDRAYGIIASGGGGVSKVFKRPWYQNGVTTSPTRVVPDFALLADVVPGWPVMLNGQLQSIGGTSGASPFAEAQLALLSARQRLAGKPRVGFINPWFYQLYKQHPELFYDVVSGGNDLDGVGCCTAKKGFDEASGMGVPNLYAIAQHLPPPSP
jgi:subtilase family serine protease